MFSDNSSGCSACQRSSVGFHARGLTPRCHPSSFFNKNSDHDDQSDSFFDKNSGHDDQSGSFSTKNSDRDVS